MKRISGKFALSFLAMLSTAASGTAEDVSAGAYATVHAERTLTRLDGNRNGRIEKFEAEGQWRTLARLDRNHDEALSLDELKFAAVDYLACAGERKFNVLYKRTAEEDLYLDIYYPKEMPAVRLPLVIYTHGGGWAAGSKQNIAAAKFSEVYSSLLDRGFAVAAVNYRLCAKDDGVTMRDCVIDAKDAARFLAKNGTRFGIDSQRFFVHGDSAGGQIAQILLLSSPESLPGDPELADAQYKMVAGVSWYGPCDFEKTDLFNADGRPDFRDRFGARILKTDTDPADKPKLYREMSPIRYLRKDCPPLLIIQGDKDTTIPVKHAYWMKEKAEAVQAKAEIIIVKNAGHNWREVGAPIEPSTDEIVGRTVRFLAEHLHENE